jgi:hypothetical protein
MKNLQTHFLKFNLFVLFFLGTLTSFSKEQSLAKADSLFRLKLYTQSFEIYNAVLSNGKYSPAMLLKMAYIQEGLGHIGQSIYYLRLYQQATNDLQAIEKMQELAEKYNLTGYENNDASRVLQWVNKNLLLLESILLVTTILILMTAFLLKSKKRSARVPAIAIVVVTALIIYLNNYVTIPSVITNGKKIYLMEGPSSGSSVAAILGDGNQLQVIGREDVWLKVRWNDKNVFVKENNVLRISL